jgi:serine/threonine-protein kinase
MNDGKSSQPLTEPVEEYSSPVSESPPPIIDAFPEERPRQEPAPEEAADSWSVPWPVTATIAAVSLTVVVLVVVIVVIVANRRGPNEPSTATPTTTSGPYSTTSSTVPPPLSPSTVTSQQTVTVTTTPPPAPPAPSVPQNSESTDLQQLRAQANIDRPDVTTWAENHWFPQLSSKRPGTFDDGHSWDYESIWREHARLRQRYDARLLWSGDWPRTFKDHDDYWVTIAWSTFPDRAGAQAWCDNHGLDSDHCFPTLIK